MKEALFGRILLSHNLITAEQLSECLCIQEESYPPKLLGEILVQKGYLTPKELETTLGAQKRIFELEEIKPRLSTPEIYETLRGGNIFTFLKLVKDLGAAELFISSKARPFVRLYGNIVDLNHPPLNLNECQELIFELLTQDQIDRYYGKKGIEFSYTAEGIGRFRVNVFRHLNGITGFFKVIPDKTLSFKELGLPSVVESFTNLARGLVLITGPKASGKSTTMATMIEEINRNQARRIITIEDPIEYLFESKKSLVTQREIERDTRSFASALRASLREDPDVIVIGEMRDLETISTALTAAETGHLVLATLHTQSALRTIVRIIEAYPVQRREQIRVMLAGSLKAVISQQLIPNIDGRSQSLAIEILTMTSACANLIRENRFHQISLIIQTGRAEGMTSMDDSLQRLFKEGKISEEEAVSRAIDSDKFMQERR